MIEATGLVRRFGRFFAVDDVSLNVPDGTLLALLGPNGAGKTTIVRMLTGVLAFTAGQGTVGGYDVRRDAAAVRAHIGLVTVGAVGDRFVDDHLSVGFTLLDQLECFRLIRSTSRQDGCCQARQI